MNNNQNTIKLPYKIINSILKTESRIDRFLLKQAQKLEVESLA